MFALILALIVLPATGIAALAAGMGGRARLATALGVGGTVSAAALGIPAALVTLVGGQARLVQAGWSVPFGSLSLALDPLSAFFVLLILGVSGLAAVYGGQYLLAYRDRKSLGPPWFFYNLLVAGMVLVVLAHNAVLFLVAWEVMSLASFFLVTFQDEEESVRRAGWTYLVAAHAGTAFLVVMFILLGRSAGSLDFAALGGPGGLPAHLAGVVFVLAVIGFGTKAGFMPLHVWLPQAHPAAPSHVSAVMSGVMIKTGIYGILRIVTLLGQPGSGGPPAWWGGLLIGLGVASGIGGVLFALAQHDLKRLLAYHSVENIGIIALGLGLGLLGMHAGRPMLAVLGFAGGLLHVANHAMFKGLLFLGAGAVLHATGTRDIDHLGGLSKKMPWTAATFLVGSVAICGLPPLNGFASEFLIYLGAFGQVRSGGMSTVGQSLAAIAALLAIGGLAAACFTKAFGIVFLGQPRSEHARGAHEAGWAMRIPMLVLAGGCAAVGLFSPRIVKGLAPLIEQVSGVGGDTLEKCIVPGAAALRSVVIVAATFLAILAGLALLRWRLLAGRTVEQASTWDCGSAEPNARMQYTASSFARPLTDLFRILLRPVRRFVRPAGLFPSAGELSTDTPDVFMRWVYRPVFAGVGWALSRLRWMQQGQVQLYVLYVALALLALLLWVLR